MLLEICKLSRSTESKICKEFSLGHPNKGYFAVQSNRYCGYNLHDVYSFRGVIKSLDIKPDSVLAYIILKDTKDQV